VKVKNRKGEFVKKIYPDSFLLGNCQKRESVDHVILVNVTMKKPGSSC